MNNNSIVPIDWGILLPCAFDKVLLKANMSNELKNKNKEDKEFIIKSIQKKIRLGKYKFNEWYARLDNKKDGGKRPIISPTFKDRIVLSAICEYLNNLLFHHFDRVRNYSYAYQKGKSFRDALLYLKKIYHKRNVILKIDIKKFFENINKQHVLGILAKFPIDPYVFNLITKSLNPILKGPATKEAYIAIKNGIPQGNAVSSILSNLYLWDLDNYCRREKIKMIRYADDMVFICKKEHTAKTLLSEIEIYLREKRGLEIHQISFDSKAKSSIYNNLKNRHLKYLGVEFDGELLLLNKEYHVRFLKNIKNIINSNSPDKKELLQNRINQWCEMYAFLHIDKENLDEISEIINTLGQEFLKEDWEEINIFKKFMMCKNKQKRKWFQLKPKHPPFNEEYDWLQYYQYYD